MHLVSRLNPLMKKFGVINYTELSLLTGIDYDAIKDFPGREKLDVDTLIKFARFFEVTENSMVEMRRKNFMYPKPGRKETVGIVYFLKFDNGLTKIGFTNDIIKRKKLLEKQNESESELIGYVASHDCLTIERVFHTMFAHKRERGEYFDLDESDIEVLRLYESGEQKLPHNAKKVK